MKNTLEKLFEHHTLTEIEAAEALTRISAGEVNASQTSAFITVFLMRTISIEELKGFRRALLDLCLKMDLGSEELVDLCGTGGDGKHTFNISTLASFVVAGAGYKVAKHGNYGVSSISGSSNLLESLGYTFTNSEDALKKQLDDAGICFMHAPMFHPALKGVGPIRKELGVKTFFNMLGPLVNPSQPKQQMLGVFSLKMTQLYKYLHQDLEKNFAVVYSLDGYDEISLTSETKIIRKDRETLFRPEDAGLERITPEQIYGGSTVQESSDIFIKILSGQGSKAQNNVVLINAACAISTFDPTKSWLECLDEASISLQSGKAMNSLKSLLNSNG